MKFAALLIIAVSCFAQSALLSTGNAVLITPSPLGSLVQQVSGSTNCSSSTTTHCNSNTLTATTAGDLLFVLCFVGLDTDTCGSFADSQGDTFVTTSACAIGTSPAFTTACAYVLSAVGGTTSITSTVTSGQGRAMTVYEIKPTSGSYVLDATVSVSTTGTSCNPCNGQALTLSYPTDVIFQIVTSTGVVSVSDLTYPYIIGASGRGDIYSVNNPSGTAPSITFNGVNTPAVGAIAFGINLPLSVLLK